MHRLLHICCLLLWWRGAAGQSALTPAAAGAPITTPASTAAPAPPLVWVNSPDGIVFSIHSHITNFSDTVQFGFHPASFPSD